MGEYLSPGVYVEEVSSGSKPIAGVGTSTGAFVGIAEKGPIGSAQLITNWTQFSNTFGGFIKEGLLAYAVYQFFQEGGTKCYVTRTCHFTNIDDATTTTSAPSVATLKDAAGDTGKEALWVIAASDGTWGDKVAVTVKAASELAGGFQLVVQCKNAKGDYKDVEFFDNLSLANVEETVNNASSYIRVEKDAWNTTKASGKIPVAVTQVALAGGNDGITDNNGFAVKSADYVGSEKARNGLHAFDVVDDINIVAIPDCQGEIATIKAGFAYCENRKDCFFVADSLKGKTPDQVLEDKKKNYNSTFGALYYPWIKISDPMGTTKLMPPSGAIAGIYSRTDVARGVHKAPAGITDGYIRSAIGMERELTKGENDVLYLPGVNAIRALPGSGICVWGARTVSADPEWRYVNVRRLFLFIEESLDKGSQWVVFEPNDPTLWGRVKRNITAFLTGLWREGALFGTTPDEAFFVKVDAENNPPDVIDAGRLIIEVGVAPVKPAEFVIIRISQKTLAKK